MININDDEKRIISNTYRSFRDHEDMSLSKIYNWIYQFGENNQRLSIKILQNIKYYSGNRIRIMVASLLQLIKDHLKISSLENIIFVPIGSPHEGSAIIVRALRDIPHIRPNQIKHIRELTDIHNSRKTKAIILLDDFAGSGTRFNDWWNISESLLLPWIDKSVKLIIGFLVLNTKAKEELNLNNAKTINVDFLDETYNIFSAKSTIFQQSEKIHIAAFCHRSGCKIEFIKGFKDCGLLIAFKHGCPNNSIPILWHESRRWKRLFRRRAI